MIKLNLFRFDFESTLNTLIDYHGNMELQLEELKSREIKRIEELLNRIPDEEQREIEQSIVGDDYHYTYEVMFPRSMRYSFIVLLYLNLENLLDRFCDSIKNKKGVQIWSTLLKGDVVQRTRVYLHKLASIPEVDPAVWNNIEDLSKVRNCIVHSAGRVELSNFQTRIRDIATQRIGLTIGDSELELGFMVLSDIYCNKVLSDVSLLIKELFDKSGQGPVITK